MMKSYVLFLLSLSLTFVSIPSTSAKERPYINIGKAEVKQSPMALVPLKYMGTASVAPRHLAYGKRLYDIIHKDLKISSYFSFISPQAFVEDYKNKSLTPRNPIRPTVLTLHPGSPSVPTL